MSTTGNLTFDTEAEAVAFVEGLQFVNDSAITWKPPERRTVGEVEPKGEEWVVEVRDEDGDDDEEVAP